VNLVTESYVTQRQRWPREGQHILAQYDDTSVVVYQAYRPAIAAFAVEHQLFGGEFSFSRMSWIKPNFLWMMFRCGWATKEDQHRVLAITIKRAGFEEILQQAVHSSYIADIYGTHANWSDALKSSTVRLQWDPDHDPFGNKERRRAIQLGLSGTVLRQFATEWVVSIEDITDFVHRQHRVLLESGAGEQALVTPKERTYLATPETSLRVGIASPPL
jgi:hypothetical protein